MSFYPCALRFRHDNSSFRIPVRAELVEARGLSPFDKLRANGWFYSAGHTETLCLRVSVVKRSLYPRDSAGVNSMHSH